MSKNDLYKIQEDSSSISGSVDSNKTPDHSVILMNKLSKSIKQNQN